MSRKVTIINSRTQSQKVIENSNARTLGELKRELDANNIDYAGMTFFEGHVRSELKDDASILPSNIPWRNRETGQEEITNDLVFMLTNPEKKIKSGAMSRGDLYAAIKSQNLQDKCKEVYGKNFTQCSSQELSNIIEENCEKVDSVEKKIEQVCGEPAQKECCTEKNAKLQPESQNPIEKDKICQCISKLNKLEKAFRVLVDNLDYDTLMDATQEEILDILDETETCEETSCPDTKDKLSKSEIDEMFDFV